MPISTNGASCYCSTEEVVAILRDHHTEMLEFERDEEGSFLALG